MRNLRRKENLKPGSRTSPGFVSGLVDAIGKAAALLTGRSLRAAAEQKARTQALLVADGFIKTGKYTTIAAWRFVGWDRGKRYDGKRLRALRAERGVGAPYVKALRHKYGK